MKHYICTGGCMGVSEKPGTCQALTCPKHGLPLIECDCNDGKHKEAYGKAASKPSSEK
jgi:coenzyme F420-reducing hydrogenase gamma subunit